MSWMNNTNTFVYFLLYVQYKNQPSTRRTVAATWSGWYRHVRRLVTSIARSGTSGGVEIEELGKRGLSMRQDSAASEISISRRRKGAKMLVKRFVLLLGSLHLTLMASLGLWLWSDIRGFGKRNDGENACAAQFALFAILGRHIPFASRALRIASFIIYGIFLIPGVNLLLPIAVFLGIYTFCYHYLPAPALIPQERMDIYSRSARVRFRIGQAHNFILQNFEWSMVPPLIGLLVLLAINIVFITDIELTLAQNAGLQLSNDEVEWEFGQILSMLLLILPLRDLAETILARRVKQRQKDLIPGLRTAVRWKEWDTVWILVRMGASPNVKLDGDMSAIQAACLSDDSVPLIVITALLEAGGDPNIEDRPNRDRYSVDRDNKDCLRLLDSVKKQSKDATSALRAATNRGYGAAAKLLLNSDTIDINSPNKLGQTALILASKAGHDAIFKILFKEPGINYNLCDKDGRTALILASKAGHEPICELLCTAPGIDVNLRDKDRRTAMMWGCANGHKPIVVMLLAAPLNNIYLCDKGGRTALNYAIAAGHEEIVKLFKPNVTARGRRSPLIQAAIDDDVDTAVGLRTWPGIDVNAKDQEKTALMWASELGNAAVVELLCATHGIQVNVTEGQGRTALMLASSQIRNAKSIIESLCSVPGIEVNRTDKLGRTALIWAASQLDGTGSELAAMSLCAVQGINVNQADSGGATALMWASSQGSEATVKVLCEAPGIDVNHADFDGNTPLMSASAMSNEAVVQILCSTSGIDVNMADTDGRTALIWAVSSGDDNSKSVVEFLCAMPGINVNMADGDGKTALMWAASEGNEAVVKVLCAAPGIDLNLGNRNGTTALMWALSEGHDAVVEILQKVPGIIEPRRTI
ncbi:ankyrin repeat-containing domain protein [Ephemerocybe angulata]|uniref:Ankyrin repeat-containing domain protein n=1 Tax=Ephemerocybe angulata TaxID=980116 RepID=A0A8H6HHH6_9AGAR|nr:ankyrin repeat-containing domain protein [Tulosesus angulatus]